MRTRRARSPILSSVVAGAIVATGLGVAAAAPAAAVEPAPGISVDKRLTQQVDDPSADNSILIGGSIGYTVRVSNSGAAGAGRAYNVSVRDVLPAGVSYEADSSSLGAPTIIADAPVAGQTTLLWTNLFDVTPAGEQELTYSVTPDPVALPVSSTITNAATAYATNDPFDVTDFSATGACTSACAYSDTDSVTALVNAIQVRKNEVTSPENELVRGVHDNAALYSITITNNTYRATTGVSAIDYIPAGLEFLGCGAVDNTTGDLREWTALGSSGTQAPRLTVVPAPPANCLQPTSVDTTTTRPSAVPPGLYTRVLWSLGDLGPGESRTVSYRVGIPLFENTNTWPNGKPISTELKQTANLDNNLGASTAETGSESSWTNYVNAVGKYQGPNVNGVNPVTINTYNRETVTAEDLAVDKSVKPSTFSIGGTATYTVRLRTSEYRSSTLQTFVDQLPDGLEFDAGSGTASLSIPSGTSVVPVTIAATSYSAGPQTLTITPTLPSGVLPADATLTVTFTASMKDSYSTGAPTASGDTYTNKVNVVGTTTPVVCPNVPPGPGAATDCSVQPVYTGVSDTSSASIESGGATVSKTIGQDPAQPDCDAQPTYSKTTPTPPFQIGDLVCFELSGALSTGGANNVLSPVIRDFLPDNLAFEPGSEVVVRGGASDTNIPADQISFVDTAAPTTGGGSLSWILGELDPQATNPGQLVVTPQAGQGPRFRFRFAARVISAVLDQNKDIKGNLLKASAVDSAGQAVGARDEVNFEIAGSQVAMVKGVAQVNGLPATPFKPNTDDKPVKGGDVVTFRIDVTNTGLTAAGSNVPVRDVTVVDDLPTGITCAQIPAGSISDGGVCSDATSPSRITWNPAPGVIDPRATKTITYDMTIPTDVLVNKDYVNRATVTRYESNSNSGWVLNQPVKLTDESNVYTANASVTKTGQTSLTLPNNNTPNQFTVGETITYTVDAVVPAGTSLPRGATLTDTIPSGLQYVAGSGTATYSPNGTAGPFGDLPGSVTFTAGGPTWLGFPNGFANTSTTANTVFRVQFSAKVLGSTYTHGQEITNTARFRGSSFDRSSSYKARVVIPNPQIAKSNGASGAVNPGVPVTFTLKVTNPSPASPSAANPLRPTSYDTVVVDCLPAGLTFGAYGPVPSGITTGTALGSTCAPGTTRISWLVGSVPTGTTVTLTYTASVASGTAASTTFTNVATVTGSTLDNGVLNPAIEGVYAVASTSQVRTSNGRIDKTVTPLRAPVGSTATWQVKTTYPGPLTFSNAAIVDVLPSGVDETSVLAGAVTCTNGSGPCGSEITVGSLTRSGRTLTWSIGTIPDTAGDVVITVEYSARVKSAAPPRRAGEILTNRATSQYTECAAACPTASSDLIVIRPQLRVGKAVSTPTPAPGESYDYTVIVNNEISPLSSPAHLIRVVDAVPDGVIVDEATISGGGLIAGATATGGGTITWEVAGPLAIGDALTFTYSAKLRSSLTGGAYTNTVDIPTYASYPTNGDVYDDVLPAQATVTVGTPRADMAIVKTPNGSTTPGGTWTFSMDVSNVGPSDAEGPISVVDELPAGLTYASNGPDWNCFPFDQSVFCVYAGPLSDFPNLEPAEHTTPLVLSVTIAATPETASYTNVAQVFSLTEDPNPDNDTSRATVSVSPTPIPTPPDPDPEKPVDPDKPVDPSIPVDPTDPNTPVDPTDPNTPVDPTRPTVQKPTEPLPLPDRLEPGKPTVVLPGGIVTNADQEVTASVQCRPLRSYTAKVALTLDGRWVPLADVSYCQVRTTSAGKVIVTATYPGPVLVKVTFSAPATPGFTAFTQVKRYVVTPR